MAPTAITLQLIMAQLACGLLGTQQHSAPSLGCNTCVGLECSHSQQSGKTGVAVPPVPSAAPPRGLCLEDGTGEQPRVFCSPPAFPTGEGRLHRQGRDAEGPAGRLSLLGGRAGVTPPTSPVQLGGGSVCRDAGEAGPDPVPPSRLHSAPGGAAVTRARPYKVPAPPRRRQSGAGASPEQAPAVPPAGAGAVPSPEPEPSPALPPWGHGVGRGGSEPAVPGLCPGPRSTGGSAAGARHRR